MDAPTRLVNIFFALFLFALTNARALVAVRVSWDPERGKGRLPDFAEALRLKLFQQRSVGRIVAQKLAVGRFKFYGIVLSSRMRNT